MKYINKHSNRGIVNLLADFILLSINKTHEYDTAIEVVNCGSFFIINGFTTNPDIVPLGNIKNNFIKKYDSLLKELNIETLNFIDIIKYNVTPNKKEEFYFTFYHSERPLYHQIIIDFVKSNPVNNYESINWNEIPIIEIPFSEHSTKYTDSFTYSPINISSEFPHGYSLTTGRIHLYYGEYITNHLFHFLNTEMIHFKLSTIKNEDNDFNIDIKMNSIYKNIDIKSLVLDIFNFDLHLFKSRLVNYNILNDIENPFDEKPWLVKDKSSDLIIF